MVLYEFFRQSQIDGVVLFAFLAGNLYLLSAPRWRWVRGWVFVLSATAAFAGVYYVLLPLLSPPFQASFPGQLSPYWYFFLCATVVAAVWAFWWLERSFLAHMVYILYFMAFVQLYKILCSALYQSEGELEAGLYRALDLATTFFLYVLLALLTLLFRRVRITLSVRVAPWKGGLLLYFPLSFLLGYGLLLAWPALFQRFSGPVLAGILLTNLPVIYYLCASVVQAYEEQRRMDDALTQTRAQLSRYRFSAELQEQLRRERHELKNRYFYLQVLLREGKYDEMGDYLEEVTGGGLDAPAAVDTGNTLMDYILNRKLREASRLHIKTCTEVLVPRGLSVGEDALCTILLNLLDNAIEASRQEEAGDLRLSIKCLRGYLVCRIQNQVSRDVLRENPALRTTKGDAKSHGYGVQIVRDTVARCNGMFTTAMEGSYFTASVMLPLRERRGRPAKGGENP